MQVAEVGHWQMQHGAAAEALASEVEDGVIADPRCGAALLLAPADRDRGNEVPGCDVEDEIAIASARHGRVEDGLPAALAPVQRFDGLLRCGGYGSRERSEEHTSELQSQS